MKKIPFSLLLILLLASWMALGGLVLGQTSKPAEMPELKLPQAQSKGDVLNLDDFSGGLNRKAFPTQLKDNEATELQNAWWDKGGALGRRKGYTHFSIPDSAVGINGLYRYYQQDGDRYLLVGGDTALYRCKDDSTSFVKIKSDINAGLDFYFTSFKDKAVIVKQNMQPVYYDGLVLTDLGVADSGSITWDTGYIDYSAPKGYSRKMVCKGKAWDVNEWAGYIYQKVSADSNPPYGNYAFIWSNDAETLFFQELDDRINYVSGTDGDTFRILSYFYDKQSWTGIAETVYLGYQGVGGGFRDVDTNITDYLLAGRDYVIEATDGELNGFKSFITNNYTTGTDPNEVERLIINDVINIDETYTEWYYNVPYKVYQRKFYQPQFCAVFQNQLFLAGDSTERNIVYYSEVNEVSNFPPSNLLYIGGADKITGLIAFYSDRGGFRSSPQDILLVTKENSLYGINPNLLPYIIANGIGAVSSQSVVNVEGQFIGFAHTTGFYGTDGNTVTLLSEKIKPFWDALNPTAMDKISAGYYDRHLFISVPYDDATENDTCLIYNIDNKSWATANIKASVFANQWGLEDTIRFLWGRPDSGFIQRYGVSNFDDGDSITLSYKSKEFDLGDLSQRKTFRNMLLSYDMTNPIILTLNFYKDFGTTATWSTTFTDSGKDVKRVNISPAVVGKTLSWGLSSKDPDITIGNMQINFQLLGGY